jgi:hypothetical protein
MRRSWRWMGAGAAAGLLLVAAGLAATQARAEQRQDAVSVEATALADAPGALRLRITNHGEETVRDVRVLVRHGFHWKDEFDPGDESPARAEVRAIPGELAPGESRVVEHRPDPPLPAREDGAFESWAELVGYMPVPPPRTGARASEGSPATWQQTPGTREDTP